MENKDYYINVLVELKGKMNEIAAQWSGEENNKLEENAHLASEITELIDKTIFLIEIIK